MISENEQLCKMLYSVWSTFTWSREKKKGRKSWKTDQAVRLQVYLIFKVEKTSEERGGKAGYSGHGILTQCAPFPAPCCCLL